LEHVQAVTRPTRLPAKSYLTARKSTARWAPNATGWLNCADVRQAASALPPFATTWIRRWKTAPVSTATQDRCPRAVPPSASWKNAWPAFRWTTQVPSTTPSW